MALFSKSKNDKAWQAGNSLPKHVAIIMDGNGRWAKKRGLPRTAGHSAGAETFRKIATYCKDLGMDYLTVYAFSTENWKRPQEEVDAIMQLLEKYLLESIEKMERDGIRLKILGDTEPLSDKLKALIERTDKISSEINGFQANICLNYGGRDEIIKAARKYAQQVAEGRANDIDEKEFSSYMYSDGIPDPDLIIRPSGEIRTSNFLLWQSAYSEYYFTDVLWPDFDEAELDKALDAYSKRSRRYGGV
ncbi:MAG: isoprenyl transferase [Oscillospiraceae bacterium]|nr:isoprenyl transferase [Oscillospiraceae bacterium]